MLTLDVKLLVNMLTFLYFCFIKFRFIMAKNSDMRTFDSMAIREEIKKARLEKGYSYGQLADLCYRISRSDLSDYEKGKRNPSLEKLEIIASALEKDWKLK